MEKKWKLAPTIPSDVKAALSEYDPLLAQLLYNRGIETPEAARQYLEAETTPESETQSLLGLSEAVERLQSALNANERIVIYGDYDVDGVTSTALLVLALGAMGATVKGYIPDRFEEGYGLNITALEKLRQEGASLVITVDCGIRSIAEVEHANQLGLDMIVTDHHHPRTELPPALAVINPKQPGDRYPYKDLAGVGLAYKLTSALIGEQDAARYLDLVALGTVADLAPLTGENRALVRAGLERMNPPRRQGIHSLAMVAGLDNKEINASHIGFMLGPRLNAAGRLDSALYALQLLTTADPRIAGELAQKLDSTNRERQTITREIQEAATQIALAEQDDAYLLFAADPSFNPGVVGLAASKLTEQFYRPSIVGQRGEKYTRASCRSIAEFHITAALDQCADILVHHGGHAAAAGFTVRNENVPELISRLQAIAHQKLEGFDLRPTLQADLEISLVDLKPTILESLRLLQPTGMGNPQAKFISRGLRVSRRKRVGQDGAHLKMSVTDGQITYDAIAFRQGDWDEQMPPMVDLLYTYEVNEFRGQRRLQLNVRDIKPSQE